MDIVVRFTHGNTLSGIRLVHKRQRGGTDPVWTLRKGEKALVQLENQI